MLRAQIVRPSSQRFGLVFAAAIVSLALSGCSLFSFNSPEKPLTTRDLNTRILVYEFADRFATDVTQTSDAIAAADVEPEIRLSALQWKISAVAANQRAATQIAPQMALLDSWALAIQMRFFLVEGAGAKLFGAKQGDAIATAEGLVVQIEAIGARVTPAKELQRYRTFVAEYAAAHPLADLSFVRGSVVEPWTQASGAEVRLVDSLGTISEAVSDLGSRMRLYGDRGPSLALWQSELALRRSGYNGERLDAALRRLDERMERLTAMTESAPEALRESTRALRVAMGDVAHEFGVSVDSLMKSLHEERSALTADFSTERAEFVKAFDEQRASVTKDAERVVTATVTSVGQEVRALVRQALFLVILLTVILLGLPFVAGYWVGRARTQRA
jgi:hypothetical protein